MACCWSSTWVTPRRNHAPSVRGSSLWVWRCTSIPATHARRSSTASLVDVEARLQLGQPPDPAQPLADRGEAGREG